MNYPQEIQSLIDEFSQFPGIGPKTAQRFVFYLLRNFSKAENLVHYLKEIKKIRPCLICHNFSSQKICQICQDKKRDHSLITIVAEPQDLMAIEKTNNYRGVYHILGGLIDSSKEKTAERLKIPHLIQRLKKQEIKEIIFALNSTIEGEGTVLYLTNLIKKEPLINHIKLSKIARGLPLGGEIEYADEITLVEALKGRKTI